MNNGEFPPDEENIEVDIEPKWWKLFEHIEACENGRKKKDDVYYTFIMNNVKDELKINKQRCENMGVRFSNTGIKLCDLMDNGDIMMMQPNI